MKFEFDEPIPSKFKNPQGISRNSNINKKEHTGEHDCEKKASTTQNSVCLQGLIKQIKTSRRLNRVVINKLGKVEPKIDINKHRETC